MLAIPRMVAYFTTKRAWPIFQYGRGSLPGPGGTQPSSSAPAFIYGTAVASTIALLLAVPLSIGIALFTNELARRFRP